MTGALFFSVSLLHNGVGMGHSQDLVFDDVSSTFFLEKPMEGQYQCLARNQLGQAFSNVTNVHQAGSLSVMCSDGGWAHKMC